LSVRNEHEISAPHEHRERCEREKLEEEDGSRGLKWTSVKSGEQGPGSAGDSEQEKARRREGEGNGASRRREARAHANGATSGGGPELSPPVVFASINHNYVATTHFSR